MSDKIEAARYSIAHNMIGRIDRGLTYLVDEKISHIVSVISINEWTDFVEEYKKKMKIAQSNSIYGSRYSDWFTPDIIYGKFEWTKID